MYAEKNDAHSFNCVLAFAEGIEGFFSTKTQRAQSAVSWIMLESPAIVGASRIDARRSHQYSWDDTGVARNLANKRLMPMPFCRRQRASQGSPLHRLSSYAVGATLCVARKSALVSAGDRIAPTYDVGASLGSPESMPRKTMRAFLITYLRLLFCSLCPLRPLWLKN